MKMSATESKLTARSDAYALSALYRRAHDSMRNIDGLQPQGAFDELLKFLFFKQTNEDKGPEISLPPSLSKTEIKKLAEEVRQVFSAYIETFNSWFRQLWKDGRFHLSDSALVTLCQLFRDIRFSKVSFDIRSAALKEFLSPEMRRGLGVYLTPDTVVKMMVEFVGPTIEQKVYDPACGSGTFLIETLKHFRANENARRISVWGTDKSPRMLLLAELNMGHFAEITFHRRAMDALFPEGAWPRADSFDVIFTNPPFGVMLDSTSFDLRRFQTSRNADGRVVARQPSEILFIEQSLSYLKPDGILAIVLPKSVVTNSTFHAARRALDQQGYIYAAAILPPETFATTGTQASTIVLFIRKYESSEDRKGKIQIALANVTNVGYDSTGRARKQNQLLKLAENLRACIESKSSVGACRALPEISREETFSQLGNLLSGRTSTRSAIRLGDVVERAVNGRTPPRLSYTDAGLFVVKVGNLTGNGINWIPRERNFISDSEGKKRSEQLRLRRGDILLTAAAHSPVYIAKKVDLVDCVPEWLGGEASFVGEVMMIRPNQKIIDPFILLAYLRMPATTDRIQMMIRGQTAHLYASDLLDLPLPASLLDPDERMKKAAEILRRETEISLEKSRLAYEQQRLLGSIEF
jgi:type I restriction enzyme M protein